MVIQKAKIIATQPLTTDVYKIILECSVGYFANYKAGQYLKILDDNNEYCFSIASMPVLSQKTIELHILRRGESESSKRVFQQLNNLEVKISLPHGDCYLDKTPASPIIFIAAGTGFAQIKCLIDYCINNKHQANKWLYWGVEQVTQLYTEIPKNWQNHNVHYNPVVNNADQYWQGKRGLVVDALIQDFSKCGIETSTKIYIAGSFQMAKNTSDKLKYNFPNIHKVYSDMLP